MKNYLGLAAAVILFTAFNATALANGGHHGGGFHSGGHFGGNHGHFDHHHHYYGHSALYFGLPFYGAYYGAPYYYGGYGYGYGSPYYGYGQSSYGGGVYDGRQVQQSRQSVETAVQSALASEGYYRGRIDGVVGEGTRSAIRAYQRRNRLPATGRIDDSLLDRLGV